MTLNEQVKALPITASCLVLTSFGDVERQPEEESITDQLSKQQAQRELNHPLHRQTPSSESYCHHTWLKTT